jgi:hypothetical protein
MKGTKEDWREKGWERPGYFPTHSLLKVATPFVSSTETNFLKS